MVPFFEWFRYPVIENTLLAAIFSGVVSGVGFGMLFRVDACSGGTDVVVMAAKKRWGVDVGAMSFYINVIILLGSFAVVTLEQMLLGAFLLYIETMVIDNVVRSFHKFQKQIAYIFLYKTDFYNIYNFQCRSQKIYVGS